MLKWIRVLFQGGEGDGGGIDDGLLRPGDKLFTQEDPNLTARREATKQQMKERGQQTLLEGGTWVPAPFILGR